MVRVRRAPTSARASQALAASTGGRRGACACPLLPPSNRLLSCFLVLQAARSAARPPLRLARTGAGTGRPASLGRRGARWAAPRRPDTRRTGGRADGKGGAQVRSVSLDTWLPEQVAFMARTGNAVANAHREARLDPALKPPAASPELEGFIRRKVRALPCGRGHLATVFLRRCAPVRRRGWTYETKPSSLDPAHVLPRNATRCKCSIARIETAEGMALARA